MKKFFVLCVVVVIMAIFISGCNLLDVFFVKQGSVTVISVDANTGKPIKDSEFVIINADSGQVIEELVVDEEGRAVSGLIDYEKKIVIRQTKVIHPYKLSDTREFFVEISSENQEFTTRHNLVDYVKQIETTPEGEISIKEVYISVPTVLQEPELPNGCEITSLTAVLNYYNYGVSKTEMADNYLPKLAFYGANNKLYGANPYKAFAGDPRDKRGGFFVYAPPIVEAASRYLADSGGSNIPEDISESSKEEIYAYLKQGIPVVIWMTLELDEPRINYSWYLHDTEEYFMAPVNLHATVINGFVGDELHVMDPLKGQVVYNADDLFYSYHALGSHAMIVSNQ